MLNTDGKPLLYDLFCKAGGATKGYQHAGFRVVGIDHEPQRNYCGDGFILADALDFMERYNDGEFERASAFHASPPCQGYSQMRHLPWLRHKEYPLLIEPVRKLLVESSVPYVIENVERAPLCPAVRLCGLMFGLKIYRHRLFESNLLLLAPPHSKHRIVVGKGRMFNDRQFPSKEGFVSCPSKARSRAWENNAEGIATVAGHFSELDAAKRAMGIDWMNRDEMAQAIPPAYTQFVGLRLIEYLRAPNAA